MDGKYWESAAIVMDHVANEGSGRRVISYHRRGIAQLAHHLDLSGNECTRSAVEEWLSAGERMWSRCRYKENRTAVRRLLEAMETGHVSPSPYSHPGPTDYSRLAGWSKEVVDSYAGSAKDAFSERAGYLARMYASQFMVRSELDDASPDDVTAEVVLAFVAGCGGTKCVRAARLSHLRGLLAHMHGRGDVPAWLGLLASDRFASHADCYGPVADLVDGDGATPDECLSMVDGFVGTLGAGGYSHTQLKSAAKAVRMLCVALGTNGARYTPENAVAWLASVDGLLGTQAPSYRRALALFARYESGRPVDFSVAARDEDPLAALPAWARATVSSYLDLRRREGCSNGTIGCMRRAVARLATYADAAGVRSWHGLGQRLLASWCVEDEHRTAEGRACYVGKVRGFLEYLADEGLVPGGLPLAARSEAATTRRVATVLRDEEVRMAEGARLAARTPLELRDAAIVALGLTMGLRSCDVVGLRLASISWSDSTVSLVQQKTGAPLRLPLTVAAGNALVSYLREGRPRCASPFVFVKHRAPYDGLTRSACRDAMVRTFGHGVTGFHVLRRTFATSLLRAGSGRGEVAEALGHRTELSTAPYLSLDPERMRSCSLPLGRLEIGGCHGL